ncbi:hypothetical protein JCM19037_4117 [Geomicrobium sp. JCM 19037]|uniref:GAF domain-containing protein n=2 Tax=unclassified Geomicrobium TaxID=2628951 RepID=UPI00045F2F40|nr:GAF domain-containing protein [Geomicrobium sp. JCM 19037]GAK05606.1 hypothetical protein JCM19037_4117 [Geomicrobium sp. JCM 19037]
MTEVLRVLFEHQPDWVYGVTGFLIIAGVLVLFVLIGRAAMKYTEKIDKELGFQKIQQELFTSKTEASLQKDISLQTTHAMQNAERFLASLSNLKEQELPVTERLEAYESLMIQLVNTLSTDIKFKPGEEHYCAIWIEEEEIDRLVLFAGNTRFDEGDQNDQLPIHETIAGRCFRKKRREHVQNIYADVDYYPTEMLRVDSKALLCFPLSEWGVLTIDAQTSFQKEVIPIAALYSRFIELAFIEYSQTLDNQFVDQQLNETEYDRSKGG